MYYLISVYKNGERIVGSTHLSLLDLYLELLVVTDVTIFNDHKKYLQTTDDDLIFIHMSLYFYHYINGVNNKANQFLNNFKLMCKI